nr:hypothetical protein [Tanacetum cinerariifolium]
MILTPRQHIPHVRSYHYHPNGPVHMMTARKRVRPLPTHHLAMRHSVDYSSSDHFTSDDSSRDSSSSSSSETSSDSSLDDLSDSSSGHSSLDHSSPALPLGTRPSHHLCSSIQRIPYSFATAERPSHSSVAGPSHKRSRSPTTSVPRSSPIPGALSPTSADLLPPPKSIRSSDFMTNLEDYLDESCELSVPRETSLRDDVVVRGSDEPHLEHDIDLEIQAEIDECIAYEDALRDRGIDAKVTHPAVRDDIPEPAQEEGTVEVTYETLGGLGHKIVATSQQSAVLSEKISELDRDNTRLRGTLDVASVEIVEGVNTQHERMILESVEHGPLILPTIEENGVTRPRKYSKLTPLEAIQADCHVNATNIILQGLPPEVYALASNHRITKELWKIIQLLMQGTSLAKQERECKLYDEFDKFAYKKGNHYGKQVSFATGATRTYTPGACRSNSEKQRTVISYNCKGEGHMSKQCTKPKRKWDDAWFQDKVLLVQAQANGQILHEKELAFLADPRNTEVALMANLSHYGLDVFVEVHNPNNIDNNMINQSVQVMPSSEQSSVMNHLETKITSDSNIIPYAQYVHETQQAGVQNSNLSAQQDALIVYVIDQLKTQVIN